MTKVLRKLTFGSNDPQAGPARPSRTVLDTGSRRGEWVARNCEVDVNQGGSSVMFSHVTIGNQDFSRAVDFYDEVLEPLGIQRLSYRSDAGRASWQRCGV